MANNNFTYQQVYTVSVNKRSISKIASDEDLSKNDYKVFLVLLTQLEGYRYDYESKGRKRVDPENFKSIDINVIAKTTFLSKKKIKKSIKNLINGGYLETGSNDVIEDGYRFTF